MTSAVVDASTLVNALLPGSQGEQPRAAMTALSEIAAPEHLGIEVLSVLRRLASRQPDHAVPALTTARRTLAELHMTLVPLSVLHDRIWDLRDTLTVYDAAYLAAAEHLGVPLMTSDQALISCPSRQCPVTNPREN